jgi:hypothetical protein
MMQPLTPMNLTGDTNGGEGNEGDLLHIKKMQRERERSPSGQLPSMMQYAEHMARTAQAFGLPEQTNKVKLSKEAFEKMHQQGADDDDLYDNSQIMGGSADKGITPDFNPPPAPVSIATQQKIGTENQQILASRMHNSQMGFGMPSGMPTNRSLSGSAELLNNDDTTPLTPSRPQQHTYTHFSPAMPKTTDAAAKEGFTYLGAGMLPSLAGNMNAGAGILPSLAAAPVPNRGTVPAMQPQAPTWQTNTMPAPSEDLLIKKLNYMIHLLEEQKDDRTGNTAEEILLYSFLGVFMIFLVDSFTRVGKYVR